MEDGKNIKTACRKIGFCMLLINMRGKGWLKISGEGGIEIGAKGFETLFCLACSVSIVFTSRGEGDQKRSTIYRHYIN